MLERALSWPSLSLLLSLLLPKSKFCPEWRAAEVLQGHYAALVAPPILHFAQTHRPPVIWMAVLLVFCRSWTQSVNEALAKKLLDYEGG
jgi:hypothetical protein